MKKKLVSVVFTVFISLNGNSQKTIDDQWGIKFSGFAKTDFFYDSRQSSASNGIREGHFYLFPDDVLLDEDGNDLNANPSFHILSIQTRLRGDISAPDAFGAKTSGTIEAEFFGTGDADINGFRLRHAFVKLDWKKLALLVGQNWHPLFPAESFPGTISFNTGAPFVPFSRNPQARLSYKAGEATLQFTLYSQRDFASMGPEGTSNRYLRNNVLPGSNLQFKIPVKENLSLWGGFDYKRLRPEIRTTSNYETKSKIGSIVLFTTLRYKTAPLTFSIMGSYVENGTDLMMLGGYAVSEITDPFRQEKDYTTLNSANLWIDISTNGSKVSAGLFSGYSSNLGASGNIGGQVFSRGSNIDYLYRIAPRITFTSGRLSFGSEIEITTAAYGIMQPDGMVGNSSEVNNVRVLLSSILRF